MAFKETLDAAATTAPAAEVPNTATASMSGSTAESSFDLSKTNKTETAEQSPEVLAETPETPEVAVDRLAEEGARVSGELSAFDKKTEASGKPLANSEFLDRASLAKKAMSLQMLSMQKKLELAKASPDAASEAGQAEVARLSTERNTAIEQFKSQSDKALTDTTERFIDGFSEENNDIFLISSKRLAEGMVSQIKLRKELEGVSLLGNEAEAKALVQEAVAPEAAEEQSSDAEKVEDVAAQLRPDGVAEQEAGPTEQPDAELREALLMMSKALTLFMASQGKGPEKGLFDRMLENLKKLEGAGAKKEEKGAKKGVKEALGLGSGEKSEKSPSDVTGAALDKFLLAMADDKKGKSGNFFKKLLGSLGELGFLKKVREGFAKGIGANGMSMKGLAKLGAAGLGARMAGLMAPQLGKLDLGKKVETPANDLEATSSQLQGINARMDAYDKENPGKQGSPESKAMEEEYAPVRAKFDKLGGVTGGESAEAPKAAAAETSVAEEAPTPDERVNKTIVPGTPEAAELGRFAAELRKQDEYENKVLDEMGKSENLGKDFEISPGIIQKIKEREEGRLKVSAESAESAPAVEEAPVEEVETLTPLSDEEVASETPAAEVAPEVPAPAPEKL